MNAPFVSLRDLLMALVLATVLPVVLPVVAQSDAAEAPGSGPTRSQAEVIERILELNRQIDELMAELPEEVREELAKRLGEGAAAVPPPAMPPPAAPPPAAPPPAAAPPPPPPGVGRLLRRRQVCNTLQGLDENGDGKISAADRYWRHLHLWIDGNGDAQIQEREVESVYDRKVREIDVTLETFVRLKGNLGEIRTREYIVLDLRGDGFAERARRDDAVLVVDATALARGAGPALLSSAGEPLAGFQAFRRDLRLKDATGRVTALSCP